MSITTSAENDEAILRAVVRRLLSGGSRVAEDARWLVSILPVELQSFFRSEINVSIREKAADPVKARKIFLSMGKTARIIFGDSYAQVKREYDRASRDAVKGL